MENFFNNIISSIGINDILDILIVAFIVYKVISFIRDTRAQQLVKGLLVLIAAFFLSDVLDLYALNWILRGTLTMGIIALVVVFQPELRRGLEYVGRSKIVKAPFGQLDKEKAKDITDEFVKAVNSFSATKTGALIILERETALVDIAETGTEVNADISAQLLGNIFYEGAPLHDGAVIIRADRIYAAGCVLPLTENKNLNKSLGTRHRAGIGITEHSDAISIIVSEETGVISMAVDGKLTRFLDTKTVEKTLLNLYLNKEGDRGDKLKKIIGKLGRKKDAR
ncbi:diadenylate cyclase CdaA [Anaerovoracaceae bacterium 41-7]|jgi:diadenylate cyclase|uniref:Diadenylate cyclase n=2 Tax=Anaerotruncus colihominis TaxID=169435 RepID=A0A845QN50_9FIRM|nr:MULTISPECIES: diadenylate cyclase CdaA [Clostridia]MCI9476420.1 TIGR00159 family protein [Emergencia sp.]MCI9640531.1 TIGR00159 family protein [Emergencia sp.]NBH62127.1 TIGR00159 family protein [Anaerotruncus colihominis]NCE99614.1 TIGR00159 family protein [Emergencia sp. 1XD21-10]NCF02782.1 TIGR00159 family protein [Anaerotruncus sp. 80]